MSPLLKIRAERDQMSAIERRIADFMVENAHLLRDYSSQQLANALKISQSSVVKFSQKLGFKGYPDLKYSVSESVARGDAGEVSGSAEPQGDDPHGALAESLWQNGQAHWSGAGDFMQQSRQQNIVFDVPQSLIATTSNYFIARGDVGLDDIPFTFYSLIERGQGVRVVERSRGGDAALDDSGTPALAEHNGAHP